jgi:hypothetical protein
MVAAAYLEFLDLMKSLTKEMDVRCRKFEQVMGEDFFERVLEFYSVFGSPFRVAAAK